MIRPFRTRQLTFKWAGGVERTWDEEPDLLRPVTRPLCPTYLVVLQVPETFFTLVTLNI